MAGETKRALIVVRTYPTPSQKSVESSCTAGICDGQWIRLFPMPYRHLKPEQKFSKYQWVEMRVQRTHNNPRAESYQPDRDSITPVSDVLPSDNAWAARKVHVFPLKTASQCQLARTRDEQGWPTLGLFKPAQIRRLIIEPEDTLDWTEGERQKLSQLSLFDAAPPEELQKIPFKFLYEFNCTESACRGHRMSCTDWEMAELYRKVRQSHGNTWQAPFRQRYEREMIEKNDTHFYVGTLAQYPANWIIVGIFYPQPVKQMGLFEQH